MRKKSAWHRLTTIALCFALIITASGVMSGKTEVLAAKKPVLSKKSFRLEIGKTKTIITYVFAHIKSMMERRYLVSGVKLKKCG